jgi:C-terminal processing protease CtpA/Prc
MKRMSTNINDGHVMFHIYPSKVTVKNTVYFPATGKIIDEKLVVTEILGDSLAEAYNIKIGDVITKINDKTIKNYIDENKNFISASNKASFLNKVVNPILTSDSENVKVEFLKDGKSEIKEMIWFNYHDSHRNEYKKGAIKKKDKFKLLENNVGYVNMGVIKPKNIPDMIEALKSTKAIVFDMRNYPQNTWKEISDFLNSKEKSFAIYTEPYLKYPGKYKWTEGAKAGFENKDHYKGRVIVLLNEDAYSQSEWTAMCFQTAENTTIIGSQTAGADGNVFEFDFKRFHTGFSGIGVYYPDKRETQRIGIVPDIEVKPTIKGIQEGKDEVLDRALAFIETGK